MDFAVENLVLILSERVTFVFEIVCSPIPSLLDEDILSVSASTRLVITLICLFISTKRCSTEFRSGLCLFPSISPLSNSAIWFRDKISEKLHSFSLWLLVFILLDPAVLFSVFWDLVFTMMRR